MDKKADVSMGLKIIMGLVIGAVILLVLFGIWKKILCVFIPQLGCQS